MASLPQCMASSPKRCTGQIEAHILIVYVQDAPQARQPPEVAAAAGPWSIKADWQPFSHKWQSELRATLPPLGEADRPAHPWPVASIGVFLCSLIHSAFQEQCSWLGGKTVCQLSSAS